MGDTRSLDYDSNGEQKSLHRTMAMNPIHYLWGTLHARVCGGFHTGGRDYTYQPFVHPRRIGLCPSTQAEATKSFLLLARKWVLGFRV